MKPQHSPSGRSPQQGGACPRAASPTAQADLKAYLDGELPAWRRWMVQTHLACCGTCREEAAWLKRLGEDMKDLEQATPSPRLRARILASLPTTPPAASNQVIRGLGARPTAPAGWPRLALGSAAVMMLLLGVSFAATRLSNHTTNSSSIKPPVATVATSHPAGNQTPDEDISTSRSVETVKTPNLPEVKPDEFNRYADEHAQEQAKRDALREKQLQKRNRDNWKQALAALQKESARQNFSSAAPVRLALAVPDVLAAQRRLMAWAKEVGGSASESEEVKGAGNPHGAAPSALGSGPHTGAFSGAVEASVMIASTLLKVPANRARELQPVLQQIGVWKAPTGPSSEFHPTLPGGSKLASPALNPADKSGEKEIGVKVRSDSPLGSDGMGDHVPAPPQSASAPPAPHREQKPFVTILVRLQAMNPSLQ